MEAVKHREKYSARTNTSMSEEEAERMLLEAVRNTQFEGVTVSGPTTPRGRLSKRC